VEPWTFTAADLDALELGARMVGSGGAGDTYTMSLLTRQVLERRGGVTIFPPDKIRPQDAVIPVGLAGSALAFGEKPGSSEVYTQAFEAIAAKVSAPQILVCAYEMAGINAFAPILVAAALGIPVADLDGMGRALPGLHQTTFNASNVSMAPCALVDTSGRRVEISESNAEESEQILRLLMGVFGGWAAFAGYAMDGSQAKQAGIHNTLRRTVELGRQFQRSRKQTPTVSEAIVHFCQQTPGSRHIGSGHVVDVRWESASRGAKGVQSKGTILIRFQGTADRYLRVEAQNEFLLLIDEGRLVAQVPQIICLLNSHTGIPLLSERIVPGYVVDVVIFAAPPKWDDPAARTLVDVANYGYTLPTPGGPR
jgi:uncharacterized protein